MKSVASIPLDTQPSIGPLRTTMDWKVVDVHSHVVEDPVTLKGRIHRGLEVFPRESMWVDPDCGLKTRTVDEAKAKLIVMVEAAKSYRN